MDLTLTLQERYKKVNSFRQIWHTSQLNDFEKSENNKMFNNRNN